MRQINMTTVAAAVLQLLPEYARRVALREYIAAAQNLHFDHLTPALVALILLMVPDLRVADVQEYQARTAVEYAAFVQRYSQPEITVPDPDWHRMHKIPVLAAATLRRDFPEFAAQRSNVFEIKMVRGRMYSDLPQYDESGKMTRLTNFVYAGNCFVGQYGIGTRTEGEVEIVDMNMNRVRIQPAFGKITHVLPCGLAYVVTYGASYIMDVLNNRMVHVESHNYTYDSVINDYGELTEGTLATRFSSELNPYFAQIAAIDNPPRKY